MSLRPLALAQFALLHLACAAAHPPPSAPPPSARPAAPTAVEALRARAEAIHRDTLARLEREGILWSGSGDRSCAEALWTRRLAAIETIRVTLAESERPDASLACARHRRLRESVEALQDAPFSPGPDDGDRCSEATVALPDAVRERLERLDDECSP